MAKTILDIFRKILGKRMAVFLCSMIPIIELRGAIPLGAGLGLPWWQNYILCVIGNMLPVPFILLFIKWFIGLMKKTKKLSGLALWLEKKAEKNRPKVEKYGFWGLALFVGIPLPMTGAWTGALVAALFDFKFWRSMLAAFVGVLMAGVIMTLASYGAVGFLGWLL